MEISRFIWHMLPFSIGLRAVNALLRSFHFCVVGAGLSARFPRSDTLQGGTNNNPIDALGRTTVLPCRRKVEKIQMDIILITFIRSLFDAVSRRRKQIAQQIKWDRGLVWDYSNEKHTKDMEGPHTANSLQFFKHLFRLI